MYSSFNILDRPTSEVARLSFMAILLFICFFSIIGHFDTPPQQPGIAIVPDTLILNKIATPNIVKPDQITLPEKVKVYEPDTVRRKQIEKQTIIAGFKTKGKDLTVNRINNKGIVRQDIYKFGIDLPTIIVSDSGSVSIDSSYLKKERRKRRLRRIKLAGGVVVGVIVGVLVSK